MQCGYPSACSSECINCCISVTISSGLPSNSMPTTDAPKPSVCRAWDIPQWKRIGAWSKLIQKLNQLAMHAGCSKPGNHAEPTEVAEIKGSGRDADSKAIGLGQHRCVWRRTACPQRPDQPHQRPLFPAGDWLEKSMVPLETDFAKHIFSVW